MLASLVWWASCQDVCIQRFDVCSFAAIEYPWKDGAKCVEELHGCFGSCER